MIGKNSKIRSAISSVILKIFSWIFHEILPTIRSFHGLSSVGAAERWLLLSLQDPLKKRFQELETKWKSKNLRFTPSSCRAFHSKANCANFYKNRVSQTFESVDFAFFLPQALTRPLDLENPHTQKLT